MRWDPWTDCDFCAGEKSRKGRCHFIPVINDEAGWDQCMGLCELYKNSLHLDCRSYYSVQKMFPKLAEMTKDIPNFRAVAKCVGPCITDAPAGINYVKKLRTRIMNVGDSAVFSCPGFDRKKRCYWKHNGNLLTSNEYDPLRHVRIFSSETIYSPIKIFLKRSNYIVSMRYPMGNIILLMDPMLDYSWIYSEFP